MGFFELYYLSHADKKVSFELPSSNVTSVDVTRAEAQGTFTLAVRCESNVNIDQIKPLPQAGIPT